MAQACKSGKACGFDPAVMEDVDGAEDEEAIAGREITVSVFPMIRRGDSRSDGRVESVSQTSWIGLRVTNISIVNTTHRSFKG